ncbi:FixH family protein [Sphingomonas sp. G124]|uniref:FixH family protein n=1 Tax=Sphingomonas cremea TaxID=2904799 RepID=A0A9X1TYE1_9SPHN|nr:FixH family protein [Sphingomonas cremea]MCF2514717.1 FixH family protein [Sphingomonas cremea]
MTKRFTGWHFTAIIVGFFGVIIAVNVTMAMFATRTFGGVVVENSYVASQEYNGWLEAARKQSRLGWEIKPGLDAQRRVLVSVNVEGAKVSGFARHPLGRAEDLPLTFGDDLRSAQALPPGRWAIHLLVRHGKDEARLIEVVP